MAGRNLLAPDPAPAAGRNLLAPDPAPAAGRNLLAPAAEEPGLLSRIANSQQIKDLMDPGKALQAADDMARIGADTATFGFADPLIGNLTGNDERAKTNEARERAGWAGTALDVATAAATAPAMASKFVGNGIGRLLGYGAEGAGQAALSAVGHGERNPAEIIKDALMGGGLGAAGSAIGGKVGSWLSRRKAKADQLYKSADDVEGAAWTASDPAAAQDLAARGKRARAVEDATAKAKKDAGILRNRGGNLEEPTQKRFGEIDTSGYPAEEASRVKQIAEGTMKRNLAAMAGGLSPARGGAQLLGHIMTGGAFTPLAAAAEAAQGVGRRATAREIEELGALVRDPSGKGLKTDPETVRKIRDLFARTMVGGERAQ